MIIIYMYEAIFKQVDVSLSDGTLARAAVPSGASTGILSK